MVDPRLELSDPATTPQRLFELAAEHPELGPLIAEHPNAYPQLRDWIAALPSPRRAAKKGATARISRNAIAIIAAAAALLFAVTGVGWYLVTRSQPTDAAAHAPGVAISAHAPSTATKRSSATPTRAVANADVQIGTDWESVGDVLVEGSAIAGPEIMWGEQIGGGVAGFGDSLTFYVPGVGRSRVNLTASFTGGTIRNDLATITGGGSDPLVVVVATVMLPSHGLTPESTEIDLATIDLTSQRTIYTGKVDASADTSLSAESIVGSPKNVVALDESFAHSKPDTVIGIDARTGSVAWKMAGASIQGAAHDSIEVATVTSGTDGMGGTGDPCEIMNGVNTNSGATIWRVNSTSQPSGGSDCSVLGGARNYAGDGDLLVAELDSTSGELFDSFDGSTGASVTIKDEDDVYDPLRGYGANGGTAPSGEVSDLVVYDTKTGATVYRMPAAQVTALQLQVRSIFDGYLYTSTTDGNPVVDVATGKTVSNDDKDVPLMQVGSWTLFTSGELSKDPRWSLTHPAVTPAPSPTT